MFKRIVFVMLLILSIAGVSVAEKGSLYLTQSFTTAKCGGLRVDLGDGWVADAGLALSDVSEVDSRSGVYFADLYYGAWGFMVGGSTGNSPAYSLVYSVEKNINDSIALGIYTDLLTLNRDFVHIGSIFDVYLVLKL